MSPLNEKKWFDNIRSYSDYAVYISSCSQLYRVMGILAEGAKALSVTLSGGVLFAS